MGGAVVNGWVRDGHAVVAVFDTDQITVNWECPNSTPEGDVAWDYLPHCRRNWTENGQPDYDDPKMGCCNIEVWVTADSLWDCIDIEVTRGQRIPVQPRTVVGYRWEGECYLWAPSAAIEAWEAPTAPLVAASPVPPVVPDSDDEMPDFGDALRLAATLGFASVVPDSPRCPPDGRPASMFRPTDFSIDDDMSEVTFYVPAVPAVTDDEAATEVIFRALRADGIDDDEDATSMSVTVVAALRSAGFLIVHHTKET